MTSYCTSSCHTILVTCSSINEECHSIPTKSCYSIQYATSESLIHKSHCNDSQIIITVLIAITFSYDNNSSVCERCSYLGNGYCGFIMIITLKYSILHQRAPNFCSIIRNSICSTSCCHVNQFIDIHRHSR